MLNGGWLNSSKKANGLQWLVAVCYGFFYQSTRQSIHSAFPKEPGNDP
jgi:hypothetical protein